MKDPKQVLDMFRTDVHSVNVHSSLLRQFDLEYPNPKKNRRKRRTFKSNNSQTATVLSLCLVTGLTIGIGSAFADEVIPDLRPLDQAPAKANVDMKEQRDIGTYVEPIKEVPPREPVVNKQENPTAPNGKVESRYEKNDVAPETKLPVEDKIFRQPAALNNTNTQNLPTTNQSTQTPQTVSSHENTPKELVKTFETNSKQLATNSPHTSKPTSETGIVSHQLASTEKPKTEDGGELPKTAGNDLNGALLGSSMALLGAIYAWRRRQVNETPSES